MSPPNRATAHPAISPKSRPSYPANAAGPLPGPRGGSRRPAGTPAVAGFGAPQRPKNPPTGLRGDPAPPLTYPPTPLGSETRQNGFECEKSFSDKFICIADHERRLTRKKNPPDPADTGIVRRMRRRRTGSRRSRARAARQSGDIGAASRICTYPVVTRPAGCS